MGQQLFKIVINGHTRDAYRTADGALVVRRKCLSSFQDAVLWQRDVKRVPSNIIYRKYGVTYPQLAEWRRLARESASAL